jgi:hypothetical protein
MSGHVRVFKITKTHRVGDVVETITVEYPVDINKQLNCGEVMNIYRNMIIALHEESNGINNEENT